MKFARLVFLVAAIYGVLVLVPQYFLLEKIGQDSPPPVTHTEYFFGFVGVALAWQVAFFVISRDPVRYRMMMIPAILEKVSFGFAVLVLWAQHRVSISMVAAAAIDLILASLFAAAWAATRPRATV